MTPWTPLAAMGEALISAWVQTLEVAMPANLVREVLGPREWIALPGARDEVPGVIVWSGRAVAVVDLARHQPGLRRLGRGEIRPRTLIVESAGGTLAVPVDRVSEVFRVHADTIRSREVHPFDLARSEVVSPERVLPLFDPGLLLERLRISA